MKQIVVSEKWEQALLQMPFDEDFLQEHVNPQVQGKTYWDVLSTLRESFLKVVFHCTEEIESNLLSPCAIPAILAESGVDQYESASFSFDQGRLVIQYTETPYQGEPSGGSGSSEQDAFVVEPTPSAGTVEAAQEVQETTTPVVENNETTGVTISSKVVEKPKREIDLLREELTALGGDIEPCGKSKKKLREAIAVLKGESSPVTSGDLRSVKIDDLRTEARSLGFDPTSFGRKKGDLLSFIEKIKGGEEIPEELRLPKELKEETNLAKPELGKHTGRSNLDILNPLADLTSLEQKIEKLRNLPLSVLDAELPEGKSWDDLREEVLKDPDSNIADLVDQAYLSLENQTPDSPTFQQEIEEGLFLSGNGEERNSVSPVSNETEKKSPLSALIEESKGKDLDEITEEIQVDVDPEAFIEKEFGDVVPSDGEPEEDEESGDEGGFTGPAFPSLEELSSEKDPDIDRIIA